MFLSPAVSSFVLDTVFCSVSSLTIFPGATSREDNPLKDAIIIAKKEIKQVMLDHVLLAGDL